MLLCRFALAVAAVLLAGSAAVRLLAWGTALEGSPRRDGLAQGCWGVVVAASLVQLALTASAMTGQTPTGAALWQILRDTHFGAVWLARAALLAAWPVTLRGRRAAEVFGALGGAGLMGTLVWGGHASAAETSAWLLPSDLVHATAAGLWPGGLLPLWTLLARARRDPALLEAATTIARRFSSMSLLAVTALAATGLLNAYGLSVTLSAVTATGYGRLLLCKAILFAGMVALGAANRRLLAARNFLPSVRRLMRNVAWESALATFVLLAAEALAQSAPPAVSP